ncbi:MAG: hypothetical protein K2J78_02630 [Muribaculaceae bacterium]|nr:hypothetical protein [Muribaculaceae bacterium]
MKKSLLFGLAVGACFSTAMADSTNLPEPKLYPETSFQGFSADGRYVVSEVNGTITILNTETGEITEFIQDEDSNQSYTLGLGNFITADGSILLASTSTNLDAAYYQGGEWHTLDVLDPTRSNMANGITPDGSRICGSIGLNAMSFDDVIMLAPAFWDRNPDGNGYGSCTVLPYPTKDLFGETPQYVTAVAISSDGKTIVGQVTFSSGMMQVPIVYTEDENGLWEYSFPTQALFNPDKLEPVENPGDGPMMPSAESFLSAEELEDYLAALKEYNATYQGPYPDPEDFMSEEEKAAYTEAMEEYDAKYEVWQEQFYAYWDYANAVMESSPNFVFNNVYLSTDNKTIVGTLETQIPNTDPWAWMPFKTAYRPCSVDIATGELTSYEPAESCLASGVADNGVILAYDEQGTIPMMGYIIKDGNIQTVNDYISSIVPEYASWIDENMTHEVLVGFDYDEDEEIYEEVTFGGMPVATPDLSMIAMWNDTPWDGGSFAESVLFDLRKTTGVTTISTSKNISAGANGTVIVPAGFVSLDVYALSGACVKTVKEPNGVISLNLPEGVYVAKGTRADGTTSVVKLAAN